MKSLSLCIICFHVRFEYRETVSLVYVWIPKHIWFKMCNWNKLVRNNTSSVRFYITLHSKRTFITGYCLVLNSRMYVKSLRQSWERSQALSAQIELKFMMWMRDLMLQHSQWDPCTSKQYQYYGPFLSPYIYHTWHQVSWIRLDMLRK